MVNTGLKCNVLYYHQEIAKTVLHLRTPQCDNFLFSHYLKLDNVLMSYGEITCDHILGLIKTHLESENELR